MLATLHEKGYRGKKSRLPNINKRLIPTVCAPGRRFHSHSAGVTGGSLNESAERDDITDTCTRVECRGQALTNHSLLPQPHYHSSAPPPRDGR